MKTIQWLAATAALSLSLPVFATATPTTYDFTTTTPTIATGSPSTYNPYSGGIGSQVISTEFGNALKFGSASGTSGTVTVSAYASTGLTTGSYGTGVNAQIATGIVTQYGTNGLAITSANTTTNPASGTNDEVFGCAGNGTGCKDNAANDPNDPNTSSIFKDSKGNSTDEQHAVDNVGAYEALYLAFNSKVKLNSLTIGFPSGATPDSDATVLYYTGSLAVPPAVTGYSFASLLSSNQWAVANGSLYNLGTQNGVGSFASPVTSQYFLIGAYIPLPLETANTDTSPDYLKLKGVNVTQVPEPTSLALFGIAGAALFIRRRRSARAV